MTQGAGGPADVRARISELDIIRGFALFGVLWMNLYDNADFVIPADRIMRLAPAGVETMVEFSSSWLTVGKAQALFSMLFGFGFALFLDRAEGAGSNGRRLYLRRIGFLLVLGMAHVLLLWPGDILHAYALVGFALMLTRRWPGWLLLAIGIPCATLNSVAIVGIFDLLYPGQPLDPSVVSGAGVARIFAAIQAADYPDYVTELGRIWREYYGRPISGSFLAQIFGRFLIGQWLYRQGWLQNASRYAPQFRRWAAILLSAGLAMALVSPALLVLKIKPVAPWTYVAQIDGRLSQIVLALGYAAAIVVLCQVPAWQRRLAGLGAAGKMALTNYLAQSVLYFFVLYGFGLGLLPYAGPTFCLVAALAFFAFQIAFSRCWLARYQFGPIEWVWRNFTYGVRQPLRKSISGSVSG